MKKLPLSIQKLIWFGDVDFERDQDTVITQVLNRGTFEDVRWIIDNYGIDKVKNLVENPLKGQWDKKSLNLWSIYFKVELSESIKQKSIAAVINF